MEFLLVLNLIYHGALVILAIISLVSNGTSPAVTFVNLIYHAAGFTITLIKLLS